MDYNHGTGHGVGAYLAVHEGPVGVGRDNSVLQVNAITGPSGFGQETQLLPLRWQKSDALQVFILLI